MKEATLALIGAGAIIAGLCVYALFRPARIALIPPALHFADATAPAALGAVPSVIHAFAMPLLTAACLRLRRQDFVIACLGWAAADVAFEFGQRSGLRFVPGGTFDPLDVMGVLLGATLAGLVALVLLRSQS